MVQMAYEKSADLFIISEQYRYQQHRDWYSDLTGTAALWVRNRNIIPVKKTGRGEGYVWIANEEITFVSCYLSPNEGIDAFRQKLEDIEDATRELEGDIVMAGDFNAKSREWGSMRSDTRGNAVAEMAARLDMTILNTGDTTTFRRSGQIGTIIDITLATPLMAAAIKDWQVLEDFTGSDHQYIGFTIKGKTRRGTCSNIRKKLIGWKVGKLDEKALIEAVSREQSILEEASQQTETTAEQAEILVGKTMTLIAKACDASMPKRCNRRGGQPAYWWTEEIAELRRECLKRRRKAQRIRRKSQAIEEMQDYRVARKQLTKAIRKRKFNCWKVLFDEINDDVWGERLSDSDPQIR